MNCFPKGRERSVSKTFVKIMNKIGYGMELTYKGKAADCGCGSSEFRR